VIVRESRRHEARVPTVREITSLASVALTAPSAVHPGIVTATVHDDVTEPAHRMPCAPPCVAPLAPLAVGLLL
jgi:hypothetical protein